MMKNRTENGFKMSKNGFMSWKFEIFGSIRIGIRILFSLFYAAFVFFFFRESKISLEGKCS